MPIALAQSALKNESRWEIASVAPIYLSAVKELEIEALTKFSGHCPYSKGQLEGAASARVLERALAYPSRASLYKAIGNGEISGLSFGRESLQVLDDIGGYPAEVSAGLTKDNPNSTIIHDINSLPPEAT
jgi:hypothetical protein